MKEETDVSDVVGIDVGGTFTDLFYSRDGIHAERICKVPSTPHDPSVGLLDALNAAEVPAKDLDLILHGTTIATNAVIERVGAKCGLITTKGFRDVLELGRRDRPDFYGLTGKQNPLIPRNLRLEVDERTTFKGEVVRDVDKAEVAALAEILKAEDVGAIVVSFLHSYANPANEDRVAELLRVFNPEWEIVTSASINREYYEFERTSTATIQAFLQPLIKGYSEKLLERLSDWGFDRQTLVMQSNGGLVPASHLGQHAAQIVRSGPAAGVTAAARIASEAGFDRAITGDMGGTSYDVAVVIDGEPEITPATNLDFRLPLRVSMINVHTIGAGGGSIANVDRAGILTVGPRSARARPGPVCFGFGGTEPTVTDANVVLARINAHDPIGLTDLDQLDVDAARTAIGKLGDKLGLSVEETAEAILAIVNQNMAGRTRLLSIERGYDPRDFALVIFGGAGPLHGAAIIREVGIKTMIVPPAPGVLCAMGCVVADVRYDVSQTVARATSDIETGELDDWMNKQELEGRRKLEESGVAVKTTLVRHYAEMAYRGQIHTLRVAIEKGWDTNRIDSAFDEAYRAEYGNTLGEISTTIVSLRTVVEGQREHEKRTLSEPARLPPPAPYDRRQVHFTKWWDTPIYKRDTLHPGTVIEGPCIVEQPDTTIIIEPGMSGRIDAFENILVEVA